MGLFSESRVEIASLRSIGSPTFVQFGLVAGSRKQIRKGWEVFERALNTPGQDLGGVQMIKTVQDAFEHRFPPNTAEAFGPAAYAFWAIGMKIHEAGEAERFKPGTVAVSTWNALVMAPTFMRSAGIEFSLGRWFWLWEKYLAHCGLTAAHLRRAEPETYSDESMALSMLKEIESFAATSELAFGLEDLLNGQEPEASDQAAEPETIDPSLRTAPEHSTGPSEKAPYENLPGVSKDMKQIWAERDARRKRGDAPS